MEIPEVNIGDTVLVEGKRCLITGKDPRSMLLSPKWRVLINGKETETIFWHALLQRWQFYTSDVQRGI